MDEEMMPKEKYPGRYSIYPGAAKEWGRGAVPIG